MQAPLSPSSMQEQEKVKSHDHTKHKLCGILRKQSMGSGRWRRRYFVLSDAELAYYKSADASIPRFRMDLKDLKAVTKRRDMPNDERFFEIHVMERQVPLQVYAETVEEASRWRRALSECANPDAKFLPLHAGPIKWARQSIFHDQIHNEEKVPTFESDIVEKIASTASEKKSDNHRVVSEFSSASLHDDSVVLGSNDGIDSLQDLPIFLDEKICGRLRQKLQIRWLNSKLPSMGSWVQSPEDLPDALRDGFLLFELLQELSPLEAASSRYLMLEKANTKKTQVKNIEVSLRILHASRRIRCTFLVSIFLFQSYPLVYKSH